MIVEIDGRFVLNQLQHAQDAVRAPERFLMKKSMLEKNLGQDVADRAAAPGIETSEKITRAALEEEARQASIRGHGSPEEM